MQATRLKRALSHATLALVVTPLFTVVLPAQAAHATAVARDGDWDGDGKTDAAVFRPSDGTWWAWYTGGQGIRLAEDWGQYHDIPVVSDYNGDRKADRMVFRPADGTWTLAVTGGGAGSGAWQFGQPGDVPVRGDYNGDGKADKVIWRPSESAWHVFYTDGGVFVLNPAWGQPADIPVPGDYNGDGKHDMALWRPSTGTWYIAHTGGGGPAPLVFGQNGDMPVPGDYNGDGKHDMALWRPSTSTWYVAYTGGGGPAPLQSWGLPGDHVVPGDFNGDGKHDMALWRPSTGAWYVAYTGGAKVTLHTTWGVGGDIPLLKAPMPGKPARTSAIKPVYFIHGYSDNGEGFNARGAYWDEAIAAYTSAGLPANQAWTWCFYSNDTNCNLLRPGDRDKPISELGEDLAWEIYDHYSRYGIAVDVVAHSMGGLIIKSALTEVQKQNPAFPPYLYIEDATTLSTPHRGAPVAALCSFAQCVDMRQTSTFLDGLIDNAQSASGTDWTLIGFDDDLTIPAWSAVPNSATTVGHRIIYTDGQVTPQIYAHMELLTRASGTYHYRYCHYFNTSCNSKGRDDFLENALGYNPLQAARLANFDPSGL